MVDIAQEMGKWVEQAAQVSVPFNLWPCFHIWCDIHPIHTVQNSTKRWALGCVKFVSGCCLAKQVHLLVHLCTCRGIFFNFTLEPFFEQIFGRFFNPIELSPRTGTSSWTSTRVWWTRSRAPSRTARRGRGPQSGWGRRSSP